MFDGVKVRHVNIVTLFLVCILNLITGIIKMHTYEYYIFFVIPFVIVFLICLYFRSYKLDAIFFFVITQLCILVGEWGNLSAALFLCYSIYCFVDREIIVMILCLTLLTIVLKFVFLLKDSTVIEGIMYCIGMIYALLIYYVIIHPKNHFILQEDKININILNYLIQGHRTKGIAEKVNLTYNAVAKRLENMREKYNCENNVQMICGFVKNGGLRLK